MPTTIEENKTLTKQEMFDKAVRHLLTQRSRSLDKENEFYAYRGEEGKMCAIGIFIPNELYNEDLEHKQCHDIWGLLGLNIELLKLAENLQFCHDRMSPGDWHWKLREIAKNFSLDTTVLNEF